MMSDADPPGSKNITLRKIPAAASIPMRVLGAVLNLRGLL